MTKKKQQALAGGGGEGHGNGTAGAVPAPAKKSDQPTAPAPKAKGGAVAEAFAAHPMDTLYVTSDGQVFGNKQHAGNHARTLDDKAVQTADRKTWGKA